MRRAIAGAALALVVAAPALAGPPYLTDDPAPTDTGHWEVYGPLVEASGTGSDYEGSTGVELNYGPATDVQLTLDMPYAFAHDETGSHSGAGDIGASIKYRFYNNEAAGVQLAVFPAITLPTASAGLGAGRVTGYLPIWGQKDFGPWSLFGGGGYAINPGPGQRNYWNGGIALTRDLGQSTSIGIEAFREGPDADDARATTSLGAGFIRKLGGPFRLLASAGPTFVDGQKALQFHAYAALGLDF